MVLSKVKLLLIKNYFQMSAKSLLVFFN